MQYSEDTNTHRKLFFNLDSIKNDFIEQQIMIYERCKTNPYIRESIFLSLVNKSLTYLNGTYSDVKLINLEHVTDITLNNIHLIDKNPPSFHYQPMYKVLSVESIQDGVDRLIRYFLEFIFSLTKKNLMETVGYYYLFNENWLILLINEKEFIIEGTDDEQSALVITEFKRPHSKISDRCY